MSLKFCLLAYYNKRLNSCLIVFNYQWECNSKFFANYKIVACIVFGKRPVQQKTETMFAMFSIMLTVLQSESRGNFQKKPLEASI